MSASLSVCVCVCVDVPIFHADHKKGLSHTTNSYNLGGNIPYPWSIYLLTKKELECHIAWLVGWLRFYVYQLLGLLRP